MIYKIYDFCERTKYMKIVFLDAKTIGDDLDLSSYDELGEVVKYGFTAFDQIAERVKDADIVITNRCPINEATIGNAKQVKLVCTTGTGTNHFDKEYMQNNGIEWRNVADYCTDSVAQHTFALLFYLAGKLSFYDSYTKEEHYVNDTMFSHFTEHFNQISGKTWGIIGLGNIGRRVADLAKAFGAKVIYYSTSGNNNQEGYERVDLDTLLSVSDIVSVHAPLTEKTYQLMNREAFAKMKSNAIFINVGRGAIVDEQALADALTEDRIAAAGIDVLTIEPMSEDNPLLSIKDSKKLIITPHIAWASVEARTYLMKVIHGQIKKWIEKQ